MDSAKALELLMTAIVAGCAAYFGAYLAEKAKGRAAQEDLNRLVRTTEEIKTAISGEAWLAQEKWRFRAQVYHALLCALAGLRLSARTFEQNAWTFASKPDPRTDEFTLAVKILGDQVEEFSRQRALARLWLVAEAQAALAALAAGLMAELHVSLKESRDYHQEWQKVGALVATAEQALVAAAEPDLKLRAGLFVS